MEKQKQTNIKTSRSKETRENTVRKRGWVPSFRI